MACVRVCVGSIRSIVREASHLFEAGPEDEGDPWAEKTDPEQDPVEAVKAAIGTYEKALRAWRKEKPSRAEVSSDPGTFQRWRGSRPVMHPPMASDPVEHQKMLRGWQELSPSRDDKEAFRDWMQSRPRLQGAEGDIPSGGRTPRMDIKPGPERSLRVKTASDPEGKVIQVHGPGGKYVPTKQLHPRDRGTLGPRPERSDDPGLDIMLPPAQRSRGLVPLQSLDDLWAQDERAYDALMALPDEDVEGGKAYTQGGFLLFRPRDPTAQTKIWAAKQKRVKSKDPRTKKEVVRMVNEPHAWRTYADLGIQQKRDVGWLEPRDREGSTPVKATGRERDPIEYTTLWDPEASIMGNVPGATAHVPGKGGGIPSPAARAAVDQADRVQRMEPRDIQDMGTPELQSLLSRAIRASAGSGDVGARRRVEAIRDEIRRRLGGPGGRR